MAWIQLWCCSCKERYPILDRPSCLSLDIEAVSIPEFELVCSLWHTSTDNKNCNIWSCACDSLFCVKPAIKPQLVTKTITTNVLYWVKIQFLIFHAKCFSHKQTKNVMMWQSRNENIHLSQKKTQQKTSWHYGKQLNTNKRKNCANLTSTITSLLTHLLCFQPKTTWTVQWKLWNDIIKTNWKSWVKLQENQIKQNAWRC